MSTKWLGILVLLSLFVAPSARSWAAPMPPLRVVNHQTRQCGEIFGGDECTDCFPPEGWESLGFATDVACPEGYAVVENIDYTCQGFKIQRCCTQGHSGAPGDCQDLAVNDRTKECAFVGDMQTCQLPERWTAKPDSLSAREWACPEGYRWLDALSCESPDTAEDQATPQGSGQPAGTTCLPCLGTALAGPAAIALSLVLKWKL